MCILGQQLLSVWMMISKYVVAGTPTMFVCISKWHFKSINFLLKLVHYWLGLHTQYTHHVSYKTLRVYILNPPPPQSSSILLSRLAQFYSIIGTPKFIQYKIKHATKVQMCDAKSPKNVQNFKIILRHI